MARNKVYAIGVSLLLLSPALWAQTEPAQLSEGSQSQSAEEVQKKLAQKQAEMVQRKVELAQRQAEQAQRQVELAHRQVELAQRQIELAKRHNPLGEYLPERILKHQQEIGLTEDQKNAVKAEAQRAQAQHDELQGQLDKELEAMAAMAKPARLDEQQLLNQLDRVLNIEREIKRNQMALAIRTKNYLTNEQQARLQEMQQAQIQQAQEKLKHAMQGLEQKKLEMKNKFSK